MPIDHWLGQLPPADSAAACAWCGRPIHGGEGQHVYDLSNRFVRAEHYVCAAQAAAKGVYPLQGSKLGEDALAKLASSIKEAADVARESAEQATDCPSCNMPYHPSSHTEDEPCHVAVTATEHCGSFCWDRLTNRRYLAIQPWRSVARPPAREEWAAKSDPANESDALDNPWLVRDKHGYHVVAFESLTFEQPRSRIVRLAGQLYEDLLALVLSFLLFLVSIVSSNTTTRRPK